MKVAIVKSRIYKGGVTQVLASMIQVLNDRGIVPDLVTLRSDITEDVVQRNYGQKIRFRIIEIAADFKMPYEWHFLYFNLVSRPYLKRYDLIIDSNNTSFLSQTTVPSINYTHYPRKDRVISDWHSIHLPDGPRKNRWDISSDPLFIARFLYRFNSRTKKNERVVCNSYFTAKKYAEVYSHDVSDIAIIYPPIVQPASITIRKKPNSIVSLGRFSEEKQQLEQIAIARQLPKFTFCLLGFRGDGKYLKKCQDKVRDENISNVEILPDLSFSEIESILFESRYFIHNVRNEPFGISTVQAIAHGCVPMVHQSGGSIEIVKNDQLIFQDAGSCVQKFKALETKTENELDHLLVGFDLSIYSREKFMKDFAELLPNHHS